MGREESSFKTQGFVSSFFCSYWGFFSGNSFRGNFRFENFRTHPPPHATTNDFGPTLLHTQHNSLTPGITH